MPELPEVETVVRGLTPFLPGKTIRLVEVRHARIAAALGERTFVRRLVGQAFYGVERRGKFIHFRFINGGSLIVHLRMTGSFLIHRGGPLPSFKHIRVVLHFTDRTALIYSDPRLFGSFCMYRPGERILEFERLGRDPVVESIPAAWFTAQCLRRSIPIKVLLLDQTVLCGLGNIYACEALFRAGIDPRLPARLLDLKRAAHLLTKMRALLRLAIRRNGTTISDFRGVDRETGAFQKSLAVYGREGEPCPRCRTPVRRIRQAQRSTYYCPRCQA